MEEMIRNPLIKNIKKLNDYVYKIDIAKKDNL